MSPHICRTDCQCHAALRCLVAGTDEFLSRLRLQAAYPPTTRRTRSFVCPGNYLQQCASRIPDALSSHVEVHSQWTELRVWRSDLCQSDLRHRSQGRAVPGGLPPAEREDENASARSDLPPSRGDRLGRWHYDQDQSEGHRCANAGWRNAAVCRPDDRNAMMKRLVAGAPPAGIEHR